jgi:hypothetical protein
MNGKMLAWQRRVLVIYGGRNHLLQKLITNDLIDEFSAFG